MAEPQPNQPQVPEHLSHLPNLGTRVNVNAQAQAPRDTEREQAQANIAAPDWIKPTIRVTPEVQKQAQQAAQPSRYQFSLDPQEHADVEMPVQHDQEFNYPQDPGYAPAPVTQEVPAALRFAAQQAQPAPYQPQFQAPPVQQAAPAPQASYIEHPNTPRMETREAAAQVNAPRPSVHVPPPTMGSNPRTVKMPGQPVQHPVVSDLLRDFGLKQSDTHKFEAFGHGFTIREVNADVLNFCMGQAGKLAVTEADMGSRTRFMVAALSVLAIDDIPVVELFQWDKSKLRRGTSVDPWWPPFPVVTLLAESLFRFFFEQMKVDVIGRVAQEYDDMYGDAQEPEDSTRAPANLTASDERVRFKCSVAGCGHVLDQDPVFLSKDTIKAVYCHEHGVAMTPIGYTRELGNLPLG